MIDFLFSGVLVRHPALNLMYAEGQVGWIPYYLERADDIEQLDLGKHDHDDAPGWARRFRFDLGFEFATGFFHEHTIARRGNVYNDKEPSITAITGRIKIDPRGAFSMISI